MNNAKKHTDVVASMEEFTTNYNNGVYTSPWVVYVGNSNDGYSVIYSNDENKHQNAIIPEAITSLTGRVEKLEDEKVYCYEDEYDILIEKGYGYVTTLDGIRVEVPFDETKWYCIYENEGPGVSGEPDEEGGSENIDDVNNSIKKTIEMGGKVSISRDVNLMNSIVLSGVNSIVNLDNCTIQGGLFAESGGTIADGDTDSYVFWVKKNSKLTINGNGVVESKSAKYSMAVWAQGGTVIINGGTYKNNGEGSDLIYASNGGKIEIHGGEFIACEMKDGVSGTKQPYSALNIKDSDRGISEIKVYGGKFHGFNPGNNTSEGPNTSFLAEGYESVELEPGTGVWIVQEKKSIDDVNNTIKNRIESGGNFVLEDDVNLMNSIVLSDVNSVDSVVNLNGKTIQAGVFGESGGEIIDGDTDSYVFWVKNGSSLEINGNGVVKSQPAKYSMAVWAQGGKVTINGGIYMNDGEGSDLIYASNGGEIEIRGGEFIACEMKDGVSGTKQPYSILNIKDSDREISRITVYGGKFHGFNPGNNTSEGPNTSFLAEGYESVQVEHEPDVWIVQKKEQSE